MAGRTGRLQQEIRQTRPFQSAYHEAFLGVMKTADCFRRAVAGIVAPFGITPQQYNVLRILRGAGGEAMPALAIGERLIEAAPGMTRLLDRLEAKRLIRRERCAQDRRQVLCRITPAGLKLLERLDPVIAAPEQRLAQAWSAAEAKAAIGLLDRAREAMEAPPEISRQRSQSRGAKKG